jgi:hypothetical protein
MLIPHPIELLTKSQALSLLLARLPENHGHRTFLEAELYREDAGKRGEQRLKNKFKEFYLEEEFNVLWNVNLSIGSWKVQMDGLLLTKRTAVIIESKNISGKIHYNSETEEFFRIDEDGNKKVFEDPTIQLEKHRRFLAAWFKLKKISMPVEGIVVFTPKQCEFISKPPGKHICKTYQMNHYLYRVLEQHSPKLAPSKLEKIKKLIELNAIPYQQLPLCITYHINPKELKTGVFCTQCRFWSMQRIRKNWNCASCKHRDSQAHHSAIREYFSIVGTRLGNQDFRWFCNIDSIHTASRLLAESGLPSTGAKKNRKYFLGEQD